MPSRSEIRITKPGIYTGTNKVLIAARIFSISFFFAYMIRFEGIPAGSMTKQFLMWLPYFAAARIGDEAFTALSSGIARGKMQPRSCGRCR